MLETERQQIAQHAALIGGLMAGVMSVVPLLQTANACCCFWGWAGGAIAAKYYLERMPQRVTFAEAARVTALAGLLAAVIRVFIGMPIELAMFPTSLRAIEEFAKGMADPQKQKVLELAGTLQGLTTGQLLLQFLIPISVLQALVLLGFTVLGGLLGVALFEKRPSTPRPFSGASSNNGESNDDADG